jgi:hypothetical protein
LTEERILDNTSDEGIVLADKQVLDEMSGEERVLDGTDDNKDGFAGVKE